jgi:tRNA threonylcarbamoyladenosine biosynthesis protein TsaB
MKTLLIDTSTEYLFVALVGEQTDYFCEKIDKAHAERLVYEINRLLKKNETQIDDIDALVTTIGPGSFTGVRLAITVAKTWGFAKKINVYGLSTLKAYSDLHQRVCVQLDARADRMYIGIYDQGVQIEDDCILSTSDVSNKLIMHNIKIIKDIDEVFKNPHTLIETMMHFKNDHHLVKHIHQLAPRYFKEV